MGASPQLLVERLERAPALQPGSEERFNGYGVMGLPFASGHVLAMRRFPVTSVGPGYRSVWHRDPDGRWEFFADVDPHQGCTRYFGEQATDAIETEVRIDWQTPFHLSISAPAVPLAWDVDLKPTPATRMMNLMGRLMPETAWRSARVLAGMGKLAGPVLGVGRIGLHGLVPNGQSFIATPRIMWRVARSRAVLRGQDLGAPGPVSPQARLGDFWIPQRGIFALGQAFFEPFDAGRHSARVCGARREPR